MAAEVGLVITDVLGGYDKSPFRPEQSPFMIFKLAK